MFDEILDDIQDSFSDAKKGKGLGILVVGFIILFVVMLLKDNNSEDAEVVYSYSSYPTAEKNAEVIIDSLYDSLQYSQAELEEKIDENFIATQDYINTGLEKQQDLSNKIYSDMTTQFTDLTTKVEDIKTGVDNVNTNVSNVGSSLSNSISSMGSSISSAINKVQTTVNTIKDTTTKTNQTVNEVKKTVTSDSKATTKTNTSASKTSTNTVKKTNYTGNSIVDGLKSVGVNSSYAYRSQLAAANGIKNYTGSASQNTALLNKLKQGTLKKA